MAVLAPAGQVLHERHLVEVQGRVQTVFVHLQLVTQRVDVVSRWGGTESRTQTFEQRGARGLKQQLLLLNLNLVTRPSMPRPQHTHNTCYTSTCANRTRPETSARV